MKKVTLPIEEGAICDNCSSKMHLVVIVALALITIISLLLLYVVGFRNNQKDVKELMPVGIQAVFLTNGQVYFGEVSDLNQSTIKLEDIYYLQSDKANQPSQLDAQTDLKLIKLGNELHGPEDMMYINREHVLFIEPLKADSKVVKAISEYTIK